jgi:hypothetical protein
MLSRDYYQVLSKNCTLSTADGADDNLKMVDLF